MAKTKTRDEVMSEAYWTPKEKEDIIWKFDNAVNIEIACNVPGHYQVGMIAKVDIN